MSQQLIIIDWGTSNFRAWLIDFASGEVVDEISSGRGMTTLEPAEFPYYCDEQIGHWRDDTTTAVYMAGMVGAAQGWRYAAQLPLPLSCEQLAANVVEAGGLENAWIVPGARINADTPDIMRGEEVQIFGALALSGRQDAVLCLPGTHSKWARVENGTLTGFTTSMTGELYQLLCRHSILAASIQSGNTDEISESAFNLGLDQAASAGGLLHQLFAARTRNLYGNLESSEVAEFLSGVLVGSEVNAMLHHYPVDANQLLLVCAKTLRIPYQLALQRTGYSLQWVDARDASIRGVREIVNQHRSVHTQMLRNFNPSRIIVVMGVTGCGKSTVGAALGGRMNRPFLDADDYHPAENIKKMSQGIALNDEDRWPWLDNLGAALKQQAANYGTVIAGCSALRRSYRKRLIQAAGEEILFVFLQGSREVISNRMAARTDHFMPTGLLDSQFATLEEPAADENVLVVGIGPTVSSLVDSIYRQLQMKQSADDS